MSGDSPETVKHNGVVRLTGVVQHYAWGGEKFIPDLIGVDNSDGREFAELWLGTHPKGPSTIELKGETIELADFLQRDPAHRLGEKTSSLFNNDLPYLFKVLDARKMLSIQVHPDKARAERGFEAEERAGIDRAAPNRNYRDTNHKPELHVALTDFWMLHGFRAAEEIAAEFRRVPEFLNLVYEFEDDLAAGGSDAGPRAVENLYKTIMTMPQGRVDAFLEPLLQRLMPRYGGGELSKNSPDFWAARAAEHFPLPDGHRDRGIFSIYMMNLVQLKPGEATFQDAGIPHAYLEGANVELMAGSDNVLRGGLTPKHIDVPELLDTLTYACGPAEIITGRQEGDVKIYPTPAMDFELALLELSAGTNTKRSADHGPDILLLMEGQARVQSDDGTSIELSRGQACFVPHSAAYVVTSDAAGRLFRAGVPDPR